MTESAAFFRLVRGPKGPQAIPGTELLYHFDENDPTSAIDSSGYGRDGQPVNVAVVSGQFGLARRFFGLGSYILVPGTQNLHLASGMTLEAWVRTEEPNGDEAVIGKHVCGYWNGFFLGLLSDAPQFYLGGPRLVGPSCINDGGWYHLVGVYDGRVVSLYADGVLLAQAEYMMSLNDQDITIGLHRLSCLSYMHGFRGDIDEVRILNRPLAPEEISANYSAGLIGQGR